MDLAQTFLIGVGVALIGLLASEWVGRRARTEERRYQEQARRRERAERASEGFLHEFLALMPRIESCHGPANQASVQLAKLQSDLTTARAHAAAFADPEVDARYDALRMALIVQGAFAEREEAEAERNGEGNPVGARIGTWELSIACNDLALALGAVQRNETPAPALFPRSSEISDRSIGADGEELGLAPFRAQIRASVSADRRARRLMAAA